MNKIFVINNFLDIQKIVALVNSNNRLIQSIEASTLVATSQYIKWFSPSLDYPCIHNPYYLIAPYKIFRHNYAGVITPYLSSQGEKGERPDILEAVKTIIAEIAITVLSHK